MALPRFIVLQSNFDLKYLEYVKEEGEIHRFLHSNGDSVASPCAKFEVEKATTGNGLVHIRCCYNNKYWVRSSSSRSWIVAGADKAEEEQSKWSCTLFEPIHVNSNDCTIRLRHVQLNHNACLDQHTTHRSSCLSAKSSDTNDEKCEIFTFIDWNRLVILPKYVAFKGDNNRYLSVTTIDNVQYLGFNLDEIQDFIYAQHEVFETSNGSVRIKASSVSKFWRRSSAEDWICPDSNEATDYNTLFFPVKLSENVIALKNLSNDHYCERLTDGKKIDCLKAAASTIVKEAKIKVLELAKSRYIHDVKFRLSDARIHSESKVTLATGEATNDSDEPQTVQVKLCYTETKTSNWDSSVSLKLGVATTIKTGVPFIKAGREIILEEYDGPYVWGESKTSRKDIETKYEITIKPSSTVTVTLSATKCWCDVPFSYTQTDTLTEGTEISYDKDDGFYTGINWFDLKYETKEENE